MISDKLHKAISIYRDSVSADEGVLLTPLRTALVSAIDSEIAERVAEAVKLNAVLRKSLDAAHAKNAAPENRPFDLEAAKRGEAIEWQDVYGAWHAVEFVGMWKDDVVMSIGGDVPSNWDVCRMRMAPRPMRALWLNVYEDDVDAFCSLEAAHDAVCSNAIDIAYPVQVPAK